MQGNHSITAHCETAYTGDAPVNAIEYKLTLTYRMYPWPQHRTSVYRIASQINGNGQAARWKLIGQAGPGSGTQAKTPGAPTANNSSRLWPEGSASLDGICGVRMT